MATAYAAVVSLIHVMDQIKLYHARQPIFVDEQLMQLESLNQLLTFLQDFLEVNSHGRSSKEMEALECQIAKAAHAAEDIIESYIVDDIHARSNGHEKRSPDDFSQALCEVIQGMNLIKKEAIAMKEKCTSKNQLPPDPALIPQSSSPPSRKDSDVVYEEDLNYILDKLVGQRSSRQVIPITGMGGIGKTTLAKIAYDDLLVVSHVDIRCWVTISQQYDVQEVLSCLLKGMHVNDIGQSKQKSLHQHLFGRRYLIVLDDMWSIEAWDELKSSFPDNNCGSRIVVTTRILNVANNVAPSNFYQMNFLDESKSWSLLCKKVFGKENCPPELVDAGKKIAKNCKGLPLSIGAVGGLLAKSDMIREYWEYVAENTNTTLNSNDEENYLNILSLSYTHLPIHLKPCFLYLGVFQEDYEIPVSKLIKLWVAEGILRLDRAKSLEEVGRDYLKDLTERNLLTVTKLGCTGDMKYCKIHDLLRDMCLVEAQNEHFLHIEPMYMSNNSQDRNRHFDIVSSGFWDIFKLNITNILKGTNNTRRLAIHYQSNNRYTPRDLFDIQPTSFLRSLICGFGLLDSEVLVDFRLLRVLNGNIDRFEVFFQMINARYIEFRLYCDVFPSSLPSSICMLWNLQMIIFDNGGAVVAPVEIWKMPQLKHIMALELCLHEPPPVSQVNGQGDVIVLENLETLSWVLNFRCTEEVVRKIPNVVKLKLRYHEEECNRDLPHYFLNNVGRLQKLQSLDCDFPDFDHNYMRDILGFSGSLRKLTLRYVSFSWEDITTKIGSLPYLEKLALVFFHSEEDYWNPVEGHFLHLKYLRIDTGSNLLCWTGDSVHFPVLEHLVVHDVENLKEIPSGIGDIATLQLIELNYCSDSANDSAKEMLKEQRSYGNESLRVWVDYKPVIIDSRDEHAE